METEIYSGNWKALNQMKKTMQNMNEQFEKDWAYKFNLANPQNIEIMTYKGMSFTMPEIKKAIQLHYGEPILYAKSLDGFKIFFSSMNCPEGICTLEKLVRQLHLTKLEDSTNLQPQNQVA